MSGAEVTLLPLGEGRAATTGALFTIAGFAGLFAAKRGERVNVSSPINPIETHRHITQERMLQFYSVGAVL